MTICCEIYCWSGLKYDRLLKWNTTGCSKLTLWTCELCMGMCELYTFYYPIPSLLYTISRIVYIHMYICIRIWMCLLHGNGFMQYLTVLNLVHLWFIQFITSMFAIILLILTPFVLTTQFISLISPLYLLANICNWIKFRITVFTVLVYGNWWCCVIISGNILETLVVLLDSLFIHD